MWETQYGGESLCSREGKKYFTGSVKGRAQSILDRSDVGKIEKPCYLRAPKELEAHILRNRSTGEYYQHTKYDLRNLEIE